MSDQEKKEQQHSINISPQPDTEKKKGSTELSEEELNKVSGGVTITKQTDSASTKPF